MQRMFNQASYEQLIGWRSEYSQWIFLYFFITSLDENLKLALVVVNMPLGRMADKFFHLWNTGKTSALQLNINLFLTWSLMDVHIIGVV